MVNRCGTGTSDRDNAPWSAPCLKGKFPSNLGCRPMNLIYVQRHCGLSTENSESESTANSECAAMSIEAAFFGTLGRDCERKVSASGKRYLRLSVRVGDGDCASRCPCWRSTPRQLRWPTGLCRAPGAMSRADLNCLNGRAATAPSGKGSTSCRGIAGYRTSVATSQRKSQTKSLHRL